ncbi:uncharacterized protein LOC129591277 [Paramacrobiotus metropolitanus]|uniref:uncharacterized protein LOC129591277 n=1 Tax=Paramacrobiotus metropolitanus TaxID=2943436 RepID=UPI0024462891|nr:uncharacterized protein LOC129591277 [Paramacrobiotus metropolitanus]
MAPAKKQNAKKSNGKNKGRKKSSAKKTEDSVPQPGYPYGAEPWVEAQPITLPETPPGHIRTVIPTGQIMPTWTLVAGELLRQKIRDVNNEAMINDAKWQENVRFLKDKIRQLNEDLTKQTATNNFMQTLLTVNEKDAGGAIQELSQQGKNLEAQLETVEGHHRRLTAHLKQQKQTADANSHASIIALEKEISARDTILQQLTAEHLELRRLEEDRDTLQSSIGELRRMVYKSEKGHQRKLMMADQRRRTAQKKAQEDAEAKLQQLAKRGAKAALDNIAQQTQQTENETAESSLSFRWICEKVRRKRDEVSDLRALLDELILDHDAVVSACEGKIREGKRLRRCIQQLADVIHDTETENNTAAIEMHRDSQDITRAIEHTFYDRDKQINILTATKTALQTELQKEKRIVRQLITERELVENFLISSLMEARKMKTHINSDQDREAERNYFKQLCSAWKGHQSYPPFQLTQSIHVNQTLLRYASARIPFHEDISQLNWAEKETVLHILFRYLCEYRTYGRSGTPVKVHRNKI